MFAIDVRFSLGNSTFLFGINMGVEERRDKHNSIHISEGAFKVDLLAFGTDLEKIIALVSF